MRKINRFLLLLLTVVVLTGTVSAKTIRYDLEETYPVNADGTVLLVTDDAEVTITGTDRDDVYLVVHHRMNVKSFMSRNNGNPFSMEVIAENGDLRIIENDCGSGGFSFLSISSELYEITLEVPQGVSLQLRGEDDRYEVEGVNGSISLRMEDGRAYFRKCGGSRFDLDIEDGSVELIGGGGTLYAYSEDGKIIVEEGRFTRIDASTEDGLLRIATTLDSDGFYHLDSEDGKVVFTVLGSGGGEFNIQLEDGRVDASREFEKVDEGENYRVYRLEEGNTSVQINTGDGLVRLRTDR